MNNWPVFQNTKDVRKFLGFTRYYRRFVKGFDAIARPFTNLLVGHPTKSKGKKKTVDSTPFIWLQAQQTNFEAIKHHLTNPPVLAFADYSKPFTLHTDASSNSPGAVLNETQNNRQRVIAYASRSLRPAETNYPAHKLEVHALRWAVVENFHDYLYGSIFEAVTDNNPLTYIFTTGKLDATGQRWVASLSNYNFCIMYRSGKSNADADGLSRLEDPESEISFFRKF